MSVDIQNRLQGRDFLDVRDLDRGELLAVLELAARIKSGAYRERPLEGRLIAVLFQKPSLRTRVSFEVGIVRLGGYPVVPFHQEVGIGHREPVGDAARVLDRYVNGIVARLNRHADLVELAAGAEAPVVNALTDRSHPCQILADLLTIQEQTGGLEGRRVAFVGDGNNVAFSLLEAASLVGFELAMVGPLGYQIAGPEREGVVITGDPEAVRGADVVYTDVWASMGQEEEAEDRRRAFRPYQVDSRLMSLAPKAIFMHCLPAHRGEEVSAEVIDGPQSVVLDQAENRLYAQMALLALLI